MSLLPAHCSTISFYVLKVQYKILKFKKLFLKCEDFLQIKTFYEPLHNFKIGQGLLSYFTVIWCLGSKQKKHCSVLNLALGFCKLLIIYIWSLIIISALKGDPLNMLILLLKMLNHQAWSSFIRTYLWTSVFSLVCSTDVYICKICFLISNEL